MNEELFETRKKDHIRISLKEESQSLAQKDWDCIRLIPEALPDLNLSDVSLTVESLGYTWASPFFVSSMTAGHSESLNLNCILAEACSEKSWMLGVGSQRRELEDLDAAKEWKKIRQNYPRVPLVSNIGVSQVINTPISKIQRLIENTEAVALFIHINSLQECLQPEGTPQFKGGIRAIEALVKSLPVPVIVKEVGSGVSVSTARRLANVGVAAIDVSGRGGTHWGRVEGLRSQEQSAQALAAMAFKDWGISTPKALYQLSEIQLDQTEVWASGGIRNGLQATQCLAMGATRIGMAKPLLEKALLGAEPVVQLMNQLEYELKIGLFCVGINKISDLKQRKVWTWETE
ncbi:MAG: hypothetical protein RJB66_1992 [Pseudomonadota bacterium]